MIDFKTKLDAWILNLDHELEIVINEEDLSSGIWRRVLAVVALPVEVKLLSVCV